MKLSEILSGSKYSLAQFGQDKIEQLNNQIETRVANGKSVPFINCIVRNKPIKLTPEEIVRQLYLMVLTEDFHYPVSRMDIAERCRILAVVGLHGNVFKPHTGTKTSVLFVQKWDDTICPKRDDYPIFFATMQEPSKDNSGEKIFVRKKDFQKEAAPLGIAANIPDRYDKSPDENNEYLLDSHGHLIVKHDLFNHDGLTRDGIAEAFAEFAKKEGLSFF